MKIENALMRGFYAGLIAGIIGQTGLFIYVFLSSTIGEGSDIVPYVFSYDFWIDYLIYQIGEQAIFGGIFGIIYSQFYNKIPGKGLKKGIVFGLLIALLGTVSYGSFFLLMGLLTANETFLGWGVDWLEAIPMWFLYGVVLGPLYERWK